MSIQEHIIENFKNDDVNSITEAITSSVNDQDEIVLPGLGVLFKLCWQEANDDMKKNITQLIREGLDKVN